MAERRCILAVFAHPDDESFGVGGSLRMYSDRGALAALVCATRGEAGEISDQVQATRETLPRLREAELREACRILGIADLTFLEYRDGDLARAPEDEAVGRIVRQIRRLRPQVVVTFDANGGYGHTDHIAIHRFTREAFLAAGNPERFPEQAREGLVPFAPGRLYYTANPRSAMVAVREAIEAAGGSFQPGGNAATIPIDEMGTPDEAVTAEISLPEPIYALKLDAWNAHRSQTGTGDFLKLLPPETARRLRATEYFVRAFPPPVQGAPTEHDLFGGM